MTTIPIQESRLSKVGLGTNPDCFLIEPRLHPESVIKERGQAVTNSVGEETFESTGMDMRLALDPLDGTEPAVESLPVCPDCTSLRTGLRRFSEVAPDGELCFGVFGEPAPRKVFACAASADPGDAVAAGERSGTVVATGIQSVAEIESGCFPVCVTPRATVCGFFVGTQTTTVTIEGNSASFQVPASGLIRVDWALLVQPKQGGDAVELGSGACEYSGGTWVGPQLEVPPGHKATLSVSTSLVHKADNGQFSYNPGQLEVCLDGIENTSFATEEDC